MLTLPQIGRRKKQPYLAIRSSLGMRQIKKQGPLFLSEVAAFIESRGYERAGPAFFRYNLIDMNGQLEMEFGYFTARSYAGAGPIRSGIMPSGRFATVQWEGPPDRLFDVTAMLVGWAKETDVEWDVEPTEKGDQFACRLEIYHNDPTGPVDPARFLTELAIKLKTAADE